MEIEKIRNLNDDELKAQQLKSAEELFRLRFRMKLGNPEGVKRLRGLKLDIARIHTIARERELHIERTAKPEPAAKTSAHAAGEAAEPAKKAASKKVGSKKTAAKKSPAKTAAKKASSHKATATPKKTAKKD